MELEFLGGVCVGGIITNVAFLFVMRWLWRPPARSFLDEMEEAGRPRIINLN